MKHHIPLPTVGAIIIICATIGVMWGNISGRIGSIERAQVSKEDIRLIVKENNIELMGLIDVKIELAMQKKNNK